MDNRSNYSEDMLGDAAGQWAWIRWRGAVNSALKGKRGQAFLRELLGVLKAMEEPLLIDGRLEADGKFCMLGAALNARGIDPRELEPEGYEPGYDDFPSDAVAQRLGIAEAMVREIMYMNDIQGEAVSWRKGEAPGGRQLRIQAFRHREAVRWIESQLVKEVPEG